MKVWPALLRVLVSIALILNGVGGAVAATRMHVAPVATVEQMASPKVASTGMPCHEHQVAQTAADAQHVPSGPLPSGKAPVPDCCKSGACTCACAHVAAVALPSLQRAAPVPNRNLAIRRLPMSHAAPALPHLIRPPIG